MSELVIIGGGFAGLWAAAAASARRTMSRRSRLTISVVTADRWITIRPRLYEADLNAVRVPLEPIVSAIGAELLIGEVDAIDAPSHAITVDRRTIRFDALVLAAGSTSPLPSIPGVAGRAHRIDTFDHAEAFRRALEERSRRAPACRVSIVGAGLTGIELASELAADPTLEVTLLDAGRVGRDFGAEGRTIVRAALTQLDVQVVEECSLLAVEEQVAITSRGRIDHDLLVWCGGMRASPLTQMIGRRRDERGRLHVDRDLRVVDTDAVWAAGDVARTFPDGDHVAPMSCQFALPAGRIAGHNAAAELLGETPVALEMERYVTCVDLGSAGALLTTGWDRVPVLAGTDGKVVKRYINGVAIHPPADPAAFISAAVPGAPAPWM